MQWQDARSAKDYATADAIRAKLREVGIEAETLVSEMRRRPTATGGLPRPTGTAAPRQPPAEDARGGGRGRIPRAQAEALAMKWQEARWSKDYATADAIRSTLREVGIEAETLVEEIEMMGLTDVTDYNGGGTYQREPPPSEPANEDPLGYKEHRTAQAKALFQPTEAVNRHKDGGTGGLLTLDYNAIPELPENFGFTRVSGFVHANEEALSAYRRIQAEEEEAERRRIAERNAQTLGARRPRPIA